MNFPCLSRYQHSWDRHATDKLHITCSVAGLNPPGFTREKKTNPRGKNQHFTFVHNVRGLPPIVAEEAQDLPGQATNRSSAAVLAAIRTLYGIAYVTKDVIFQNRRRVWRRRVQARQLFFRPRVSPHNDFGAFADLKGICHSHGWNEPEVRVLFSGRNNKVELRLVPSDTNEAVTRRGRSVDGIDQATDIAAEKILNSLPMRESSADRRAVTTDKRDPTTPLGALCCAASNVGGTVTVKFGNDRHHIFAEVRLQMGDESYQGISDPGSSERVTANQASLKLLSDTTLPPDFYLGPIPGCSARSC